MGNELQGDVEVDVLVRIMSETHIRSQLATGLQCVCSSDSVSRREIAMNMLYCGKIGTIGEVMCRYEMGYLIFGFK